ncbi:hypothetical protein AAW00_10385 [Aurantiacibacter luteus]|uniref:Methyltransferase n=2 Tax=Aurantiacibacter luteus TaxID=1581420 RepID=A0A0G9N028_9SPHN|nr:hypothetical protein AAW00_10385 [Aurantiacibacter luteus]
MRLAAILATALTLGVMPAPAAAQEAMPGSYQERALNMESVLLHPRRERDRARDQYRHPAETLEFFGVMPGMTVVDVMPASGWYTRVLVPYLGSEGTYIGLDPLIRPGLSAGWNNYANAATRLPESATGWVGSDGAPVVGLNVGDEAVASRAGTVDRVLIFREIHNLRRMGFLHDTLVAARTLLKPDGMIGVVQHRANPDAPADYVLGNNGYQREQDVIGMFEAYGFELVARSEINANPNDPADWEGGVWNLPPSFGNAPEGSPERARRAAIGESDRMTLLFRKRP